MSKPEIPENFLFRELTREANPPGEDTIPRDGDAYGEASRFPEDKERSAADSSGSLTANVVSQPEGKAFPKEFPVGREVYTDDPDFIMAKGGVYALALAGVAALALAFIAYRHR